MIRDRVQSTGHPVSSSNLVPSQGRSWLLSTGDLEHHDNRNLFVCFEYEINLSEMKRQHTAHQLDSPRRGLFIERRQEVPKYRPDSKQTSLTRKQRFS